MVDFFATESAQMVTTAGDVDRVNEEVKGDLSRIRGVVDGLAGDWRGQAKVAFDELMVRWDDAALRLSSALSDISENIRANSSQFDQGEEDNRQSFSRVGAAGASLLNL